MVWVDGFLRECGFGGVVEFRNFAFRGASCQESAENPYRFYVHIYGVIYLFVLKIEPLNQRGIKRTFLQLFLANLFLAFCHFQANQTFQPTQPVHKLYQVLMVYREGAF